MLSAFVLEDSSTNEFRILSLATGTKSIGNQFMNENGFVLNDCHAEILAKRSLNYYFLHSLLNNPSELFEESKTESLIGGKRY